MPPLASSLIPSVPTAVKKSLNPPFPGPSLEAESISRRHAAILYSSIIATVLPSFVRPLRLLHSHLASGQRMAQKKKSYKFLLAPVDAYRNFLQFAYLLSKFSKNDLEEVQKLLVSAAGDCAPPGRNSFVTPIQNWS